MGSSGTDLIVLYQRLLPVAFASGRVRIALSHCGVCVLVLVWCGLISCIYNVQSVVVMVDISSLLPITVMDLVAFVHTNHCCNLQGSYVAWTLENKSSLSNPEPTEFFYSFCMVNQWIILQQANRTTTL